MALLKLHNAQRQFFSLVSAATFTNPFSPQRQQIDRQISQASGPRPWSKIVLEVIAEVKKSLAKLDADRPRRIEDFTGFDRDLFEHAVLFDIFHDYIDAFDAFIIEQAGAPESLPVTFAPEALAALTRRGFAAAQAKRYFSLYYQLRRGFHFIDRGLVGDCASMQNLRMDLWNNIFTHDIRYYERYLWDKMEDFSTLLLGPTGSGKGAAAAAIGRSGFIPFDEKKGCFAENFTKTFVAINLTQFAETLLESELFGHKKGSFTGATSEHQGLLALCGAHSSIFLDEIGDISPQVQLKLLRVLEERVFCPVGSHEELPFRGRIIAATNKALDDLRRRGQFRDDFYYRLCSDCVSVPSLRQRIGENEKELEELIAHTLRRIAGEEASGLAPAVRDVITMRLGRDYAWPGNVRELAQCIRRIIIRRDYAGDSLTRLATPQERFLTDIAAGSLSAPQLLAGYCRLLHNKHGTYEAAARRSGLDRRTVKKYVEQSAAGNHN